MMEQTDYGTDDPLWIDNAYLDTIVTAGLTLFVLCLMKLSKVHTAKLGMILGMLGMTILIIGYWIDGTYTYDHGKYLIAASMAPGLVVGMISAISVEITGLPVLVGAYNGFGGLAAALEGIGLYLDPNAKNFVRGGEIITEQTTAMLWVQAIALVLSIVIGMMTFTGSMVACLKLRGTISSKPRIIPLRPFVTLIMFAIMTVLGVLSFTGGQDWNDRGLGITFISIIALLASVYGVIAVMSIGGGDMPVSISFLNALSGFSTSFAGFMLSNKALVVAGAFVGCSGIILTLVMCQNMNRSMSKVLIGGFGDGAGKSTKAKTYEGIAKEVTAEDVTEMLTGAKTIIICPGYGMATAKAQHVVAAVAEKLRARGINVLFAIHPVAGRLPGHMNVLLAEARVPYDITFSLDDINHEFPNADIAIVLGANDIVNPSAQTDPDSPIAGMPILEAFKAKRVICMKRSLKVGYAGVDNPLFFMQNNYMFLGDARDSLSKVNDLLGSDVEHTAANTVVSDIESATKKNINDKIDTFYDQITALESKAFLKVGVCKEIADSGEKRVAMVPDVAKKLLKKNIRVVLESGFNDHEYMRNGCQILNSAQAVYDSVDVVIKIREPSVHPITGIHEIDMLGRGKTMITFVGPSTSKGMELMQKAKDVGINLLSVDSVPRVSRAQSLDVLSSQAKIAGYKAVTEAANIYQRFMNGEVTAAGNFQACKVLVIGAGVAGLAAISTASNMGAIVRAFDTRLECKEQVESLGGEFLVLDFGDEKGADSTGYSKVMSDEFYRKEMELFQEQCKECQIIITTAAIPGRPSPKLIMQSAVDNLSRGSIIVDLAASGGGNCELTKPGITYVYDNRVTIVGATDLNSQMSWQASSMYAENMASLLEMLCKDQKFVIDMQDSVVRGMTCVHDSTITWPPPQSVTQTSAEKSSTKENETLIVIQKSSRPSLFSKRVMDLATIGELSAFVLFAGFFVVIGIFAPVSFVQQLLYFILAGFLGYYLIWAVEPALFSPLMSTSNSLSGVVILGGILMASNETGSATNVLGCISIAVAAINVFGGFTVSYRMLLMFKKGRSKMNDPKLSTCCTADFNLQ